MKENRHKDLGRYRLEKAFRNLSIARENYQIGFYDEAVTKSYYAILTAMRSVLSLKHLDSKRHEGVIRLFNEHFIKEKLFPKDFNKIVSKMKNLREDADYGDFVEITKETAIQEIENAEKFLKKTEEVFIDILRQTNHANKKSNSKIHKS